MLATSGRPVLYRGQRVGRGGRFFTMLKFRTLTRDAESRLGPLPRRGARRAAPRPSTRRIGRWLKASQLDEIPQLWNVLRGDMSFVGPRPIRARFFAELAHRPAGLLAATRRPARAHRLRAGAARLRDLDGREALARPRVDRRPLRPALPADARLNRLARPAADASGADARLGGEVRRIRARARAGRPARSSRRRPPVITRSSSLTAAKQPAVQLGARVGQLEPPNTPVVRVGLPADEPVRLEPVDVVRDRRALEMDVTRERRLADDPDVAERAQHDPRPERPAGFGERRLERLTHRLCREDELRARAARPDTSGRSPFR